MNFLLFTFYLEETIVKVESCLSDVKTCSYNDENMVVSDVYPSPINILQQTKYGFVLVEKVFVKPLMF